MLSVWRSVVTQDSCLYVRSFCSRNSEAPSCCCVQTQICSHAPLNNHTDNFRSKLACGTWLKFVQGVECKTATIIRHSVVPICTEGRESVTSRYRVRGANTHKHHKSNNNKKRLAVVVSAAAKETHDALAFVCVGNLASCHVGFGWLEATWLRERETKRENVRDESLCTAPAAAVVKKTTK